jgi:transposase
MTQKRNYKQYPKEFKEEAVALITEQGYTVAKAAEALGVATNMLYRWKENAEKQKAGISLSEDERTELKGLRQEVKTLRIEKEILKKASVSSSRQCNAII